MLRNLNKSASSKRVLGIPRVGVQASQIPTGFPQPPLLLNDIDAGFPNRYYRVRILTGPTPAGAVLDVAEDSSGSLTGPAGTYTGTMEVSKFDEAVGLVSKDSGTYSFTISSATGGTTQVSADQVAIYDIHALVSADQVASYTVMGRVSADQVATYAILTEGQSMSFTPSAARTIKIKAASRTFEGGSFWDLSNPKRPVGGKDPDSTIDITFDWSDVLADIQDTMALADFTIAGGLIDAGSHADGALATVFVSAGIAPEVSILCKMTSSSIPPRVEEYTVYLKIGQQ